MKKRTSSEEIEAYRQSRKSRFNAADISKVMVFSFILVISFYFAFSGGPELPALVELKTNTPIFSPSFTTAPTRTSVGTLAFDECNCPSPQETPSQTVITVIVVVSPTLDKQTSSATDHTITVTTGNTFTPTASDTPTPTPRLYIVQPKDTLSGIALRFNVTIQAIQDANGMGDSTLIVVGQTLIIPR
jgi:LysM repeat protein